MERPGLTTTIVAALLGGAAAGFGAAALLIGMRGDEPQTRRAPVEPTSGALVPPPTRQATDDAPWDELLAELSGIRRSVAELAGALGDRPPSTRVPLEAESASPGARTAAWDGDELVAARLADLVRAVDRLAVREGVSSGLGTVLAQRRPTGPTPELSALFTLYSESGRTEEDWDRFEDRCRSYQFRSYQEIADLLGPPHQVGYDGSGGVEWNYEGVVGDDELFLQISFFDGMVIGID